MKIVAITQARLSSSRLPGKVLLPLGTTSLLGLHLKRLKMSKRLDEVMVATTHEQGVDQIIETANRMGCLSFQGSLDDVLDRFYRAAKKCQAEIVVRVTSDCPLIDPVLVDDLIEKFLRDKVDYSANCRVPNLPDGFDAEIISFDALEKAWREASLPSEREHVTPYIWKNSSLFNTGPFKASSVDYGLALQDWRVTVDQQEDYLLVSQIVDMIGENASMEDIVKLLSANPSLRSLNSGIINNEGYLKSLAKDPRK